MAKAKAQGGMMAGPLKDLVKTMMGSREAVHPSIQAFPSLDIEQIASELRLDDRASEAGQRDQPPTDGSVEDVTELDIAAELERRARKGGEDYRAQLDLYEARIRRALITTDQAVAIEAAGESAVTDFKVQAIDDLNQLHLARKEVEGREQEFEGFRLRNRLTRLPDTVSHREMTARALVLAIFIVLESVLNGIFFAEGSEAGLIGGMTQASVLSVLNIGVAVLFARLGLPLVRHVSGSVKAVGVIVSAAYAAWAIFLNLAIAHFRDLYIQNAGTVPAMEIWTRLSTAPFVLVDTQSWLLAMLGIGLSLVALIDAAGMDDRYPGYGDVGRRREDAISRYANDKAQCLAGLTARRNEAIGVMSQVIEVMRSAEYDLRLAVEGRSRLHQNYCAFLSHLKDGHERMLRRYYEVNVRHRQSPPPTRFQSRPLGLAMLSPSVLADLPDLQKDTRQRAIERMEHFIKAVNRQFEEEVTRYHTVTGLTALGSQGSAHGFAA